MKYMKVTGTDIYYNLALEEYMFNKSSEESVLLLWKNDTSIVLGKYQNVYEEINIKEVSRQHISVARRNTGGGTVFHDRGNLNYSFITNCSSGTFSDYDEFIFPVIKALNGLGVPAQKRNNSDIAIGTCKISGSAQAVKSHRILHHGTLLFDADMEGLHLLLKPSDGRFTSKAVKSVRSDVTNISDHLRDKMTIDEFEEYLLENIISENDGQIIPDEDELKVIEELAEKKYRTWEWNYGKSPKFVFEKRGKAAGKQYDVRLAVEKGIITDCSIESVNGSHPGEVEELLREKLVNQRYKYDEIKAVIQSAAGQDEYEEFTDILF